MVMDAELESVTASAEHQREEELQVMLLFMSSAKAQPILWLLFVFCWFFPMFQGFSQRSGISFFQQKINSWIPIGSDVT